MMLYNPLAAPTEWFLQIYNILPLPFRNFVNVSFFVVLAITAFAVFWGVKH